MAWKVSGFTNICPVPEGVALCDGCLQPLRAQHWHEQGPRSGLKHGYGMYPEWPIGVWGFCSQKCGEALLSALIAHDIAQRVYGNKALTRTA